MARRRTPSRSAGKFAGSLAAELPRMMSRVAARVAGEAELPPAIRRIDVVEALAAIGQAAEALATAEAVAYIPAYARLKSFDG